MATAPAARWLSDANVRINLGDLHAGSSIGGQAELLRGRSVLFISREQLPTTLAAIELDGIARRIVLCPPDLAPEHLPGVLREAEIDAIISDGTNPPPGAASTYITIRCRGMVQPIRAQQPERRGETQWVLFTSGTIGRPKMVVHTLRSLSGPLNDGLAVANGAVWSTFYDVRRYGGLQILLRALIGGGSMVLSSAQELVNAFLGRAAAAGVTHISGTPSHWRRALMSPFAKQVSPQYVRLSGEVADQGVLDNLRLTFPRSDIAHAFASTEAGVAFDVRDGKEGFPESYLNQPDAKAEMRVTDGSLRIRSVRTASGYLGDHVEPLRDDAGFVDTGDMVEQRGDRCFFVGRREGVINVGGLKVHPEEVEAVINRHPKVLMSRVWARNSPIIGAIVAAEIVVRHPDGDTESFACLRRGIIDDCRRALDAYKVPATFRQVESLEIGVSGKLMRRTANMNA